MEPNQNNPTQTPPEQSETGPANLAPVSNVDVAPPSPNVAPSSTPAPHSVNSPGIVVLQWLTYAFWGWTVLALGILTAAVFTNFVTQDDTSSLTTYSLAALLVLLPISITCDLFYSKKEPLKKTGAATIVMVIHAVIFALFGIGSLIAAVFAVVQMLVSSDSSETSQVALYSSLVIAVVYSVVFARTLNPEKFPVFKKIFIPFMVIATVIIVALGIAGPIAYERTTRDDRLIEQNLYDVEDSISDYTRQYKHLPENLGSVQVNEDTKKLLEKNLVKYRPNSKPKQTTTVSRRTTVEANSEHFYELCATYKKASKNENIYDSPYESDEYRENVYTSAHPAGEVCYKLKVSVFGQDSRAVPL